MIGFRELIYDNSHKVIVDGNGYYYTYDDKGFIVSSLESLGTIHYTYDTNGDLTRADYPSGFSDPDLYTYNSSGQLITAVTASFGTIRYEYPNSTTKNPSKVTSPGCCGKDDVHEYLYDNNPNPEAILFPSIHSDNNIIADTYTLYYPALPGSSDLSSPIISTGTLTYAYQYNEKGYPIKFTRSDGLEEMISYDCK